MAPRSKNSYNYKNRYNLLFISFNRNFFHFNLEKYHIFLTFLQKCISYYNLEIHFQPIFHKLEMTWSKIGSYFTSTSFPRKRNLFNKWKNLIWIFPKGNNNGVRTKISTIKVSPTTVWHLKKVFHVPFLIYIVHF